LPRREQAVPPSQAAVAPCVVYHLKMIPANPNVDPKMIVRRPQGAPVVEYRMPDIPSNRCR
jgi:hypothetical protein